MRIAILASRRFHLLDLARELAVLGHEVTFYAIVPPGRCRVFGLPDGCGRWLLPYVAPFFAAAEAARAVGGWRMADHAFLVALDWAASVALRPCDVFIGLSGLSVRVLRAAREKYGAKIILERGSRHIRSQKEILDTIPRLPRSSCVPSWALAREEVGYTQADLISVPSRHVEESFLGRGFPKSKLFRNSYGVDLHMFVATPAPPADPPTIIMAGTWSLRKGCDVLVEAWRRLPGVRLLHVGPVLDAPLPRTEGFVHHDKVDQSRLLDFYRQAHVFVLASREEGLSMVQAQALAAGLPLVCTTRTGGEDLREGLANPEAVRLVPPDDPAALAQAISGALDYARRVTGLRDLLGTSRERLSWAAYAERYDGKLRELVQA